MFGFGAPEFIVLFLIAGAFWVFLRYFTGNYDRTDYTRNRKCLSCGYIGFMNTWISDYPFPKFIIFLGLLFWLLPGLIFMFWAWGKYKCPKCGALDKSIPISPAAIVTATPDKKCPYCAEDIKSEAVLCRYCGRDFPTVA